MTWAVGWQGVRELVDGEVPLPGEEPAASERERDALLAGFVRAKRNTLLRGCDWTQITDAPLAATVQADYARYRQALRDLTTQPGFPYCVWPDAPRLPDGAASEIPANN